MGKDPVCGMDVDEREARFKTEYEGQIYYFCSPSCMEDFKKDPTKYIG